MIDPAGRAGSFLGTWASGSPSCQAQTEATTASEGRSSGDFSLRHQYI